MSALRLSPELAALDGEFEFLREIGRGGMAQVYLARERMLDREVAIKVIRADLLEDDETLARFEREARTVARLSHPGIVALYGIRRVGERGIALVMPYLAGGTLKARIRARGAMPVTEAIRVLGEVAEALGYAHRQGVVHRDLKPENVFLDAETGRALLGDFGIARAVDAGTRLTVTGAVLGTPAYMAPEQLDDGAVDARCDIYSLGLIGYEMLTGRMPWEGHSLLTVMYKQKHEMLPGLETVRGDLPDTLVLAVEGCLGKEPGERWESAEELLAVIDGREEGLAALGTVALSRKVELRPEPPAPEPDWGTPQDAAEPSDDLMTGADDVADGVDWFTLQRSLKAEEASRESAPITAPGMTGAATVRHVRSTATAEIARALLIGVVLGGLLIVIWVVVWGLRS